MTFVELSDWMEIITMGGSIFAFGCFTMETMSGGSRRDLRDGAVMSVAMAVFLRYYIGARGYPTAGMAAAFLWVWLATYTATQTCRAALMSLLGEWGYGAKELTVIWIVMASAGAILSATLVL